MRRVLIGLIMGGMLLCSPQAFGQLTILSQGNKQAKWKESQLAALQSQLLEPQLTDELKLELQSQSQWLSAWKPGELASAPLLPEVERQEVWQEPELDPEGLAVELRKRLLGKGAKPTAEDTKQLQQLLTENDNDLGVRQLHLHWLDQKQYRKTYPQEIADAAAKVVALLDAVDRPDRETELARAFCWYRRGRALAYRELPDVLKAKPMTDEERKMNQAELLGAQRELKKVASEPRIEFVLLDVRMLRQDHWNGRALALLEGFAGQLSQQWFLKKRRDILRNLGWEGPANEAAVIYAKEFPEEVAKEAAAELDPASSSDVE